MMDLDPCVSVARAAELEKVHPQRIYEWILERRIEATSSGDGPGGRAEKLVRVRSLSMGAQIRYWQEARPQDFRGGELANYAEMPARNWKDAQRRIAIVIEARDAQACRVGAKRRLVDLAARHEIRETTLYAWLRAYKARGIAGLVSGYGKTRGTFHSIPTELQQFIRDEYCQPTRPSIADVYLQLQATAGHLRVRCPSQSVVVRFIRSLPPAPMVLAREGRRAWRAKCEPKCHRDLSASRPNEWWCGDHRELDVFVRLSADPGAKIARVWFTAWLDLATRTLVGWHLRLRPNSESIALALRQGFLAYGIPEHLYIDNGKDFRCHYLNGSTEMVRDVRLSDEARFLCEPGALTPLGIGITHAKPYQPWSKPIEPWFAAVLPRWERTLPGWCGSDAKAKPEKLAQEVREGRLLTIEELRASLAAHLRRYHEAPHNELDEKSPSECWQGVTIERPDPRALDLLLMRHKAVKVYHQGVKLFGAKGRPRYYRHDALWSWVGQTVDVRYDEQNIGTISVFLRGKFLCEAVNEEALRMGASKEDLTALHKRKRRAYEETARYPDNQRVLTNEDQALEQIARTRQAAQVVNLGPRDPDPAPGTQPIPRITGFETAASSRERGAEVGRRTSDVGGRTRTTPDARRPAGSTRRPAPSRAGVPPRAAASGAQMDSRVRGNDDLEEERSAIMRKLTEMYR